MDPADQTPAAQTAKICTQPARDGRIKAENAVGQTTQPAPNDADDMVERIRAQRPPKEGLFNCVARGLCFGFASFGFSASLIMIPLFGSLASSEEQGLGLTYGLMMGLVFGVIGGVLGCMAGFFLWLLHLGEEH